MKIRNGFVSNSSSSSFICISDEGQESNPIIRNRKLTIPRTRNSEYDFNGGEGRFYDFDTKLNFIYLQVLYRDDNTYYQMLIDVLKETLGVDEIEENLVLERDELYLYEDGEASVEFENKKCYGNIDHGSIFEEIEFEELFKDTRTLRDFLFNQESYFEVERS